MGLLACATAVLLIGVVIGRVTAARSGVDEVYLRNSQPTPTPERTAPAQENRDRPGLDPVARAETPMAEQDVVAGKRREAGGRPSHLIDGSGGGSKVNTVTPEISGGPAGADNLPGDPELESQVVRLVNAERARYGCRPLRVDARLVRSARAHSMEMAASDNFEHSSPDGTTPWQRMAAAGYSNSGAETIARGFQTAEGVVHGWMASSSDRRTLLTCKLVATGVGMAFDGNTTWWTEDFGYS
ncbi:CAP domain-containing protein [Microbispora sp. NPDC049125]|uniref:CAP domain-containing protein n=1 Tax=Microbispora sp. NPDC049125 TaxID=3154929 RepID=UPI00346743E9